MRDILLLQACPTTEAKPITQSAESANIKLIEPRNKVHSAQGRG